MKPTDAVPEAVADIGPLPILREKADVGLAGLLPLAEPLEFLGILPTLVDRHRRRRGRDNECPGCQNRHPEWARPNCGPRHKTPPRWAHDAAARWRERAIRPHDYTA